MSINLFGEETKCDIRVGYISTDRGFVEGIKLYEANQHAQLNPGTQFIFRNRDKVEYLNINEVNELVPADMLPIKNAAYDKCSGIVGLNLEGDTTKSTDVAFDLAEPLTGGTTINGASDGDDKTNVNFYGGGGGSTKQTMLPSSSAIDAAIGNIKPGDIVGDIKNTFAEPLKNTLDVDLLQDVAQQAEDVLDMI